MRVLTPLDPYLEYSDGYLELVEDDSSLFRDIPALVPTPEQDSEDLSLPDPINHCYRVRATGEAKRPALHSKLS